MTTTPMTLALMAPPIVRITVDASLSQRGPHQIILIKLDEFEKALRKAQPPIELSRIRERLTIEGDCAIFGFLPFDIPMIFPFNVEVCMSCPLVQTCTPMES